MRRSDSCPTWAIAGRSASSASASAIGWKLPLLSIRPDVDVDQRVVVHRVELDRHRALEDVDELAERAVDLRAHPERERVLHRAPGRPA